MTYGLQMGYLKRMMSLMAEWLEQRRLRDMKCSHDLEVMSSNPGQVELWVHSTSKLYVKQ